MSGEICKAIVTALRASELVDENNVSIVLANDNGEGTVNTDLPAIAVSVKGTERDTGEFIGGMIYNQYIVQLSVITPFENQAASPDDDHQYDQMNLAYKVMLYMAACSRGVIKNSAGEWVPLDFFTELRQKYGFTLLYKETETYQTIAMEREMANIPVHNTRLIYMANFVDNSTYEQDSFLCDAIEMKCLCDTVRNTNS
jgi:hypothetical protein